MSHPGDDSGFGSLLDRDAFRAGHGSASYWCGVVGDGLSQPVREVGVVRVKSQKGEDRQREVFDVLVLDFFTATGGGLSLLSKVLGRSFAIDFRTDSLDRRRLGPDTA